jgi:hypothetical protein
MQCGEMFLTDAEVIELTHKSKRAAQVRALRQMGIDHKIRPDGTAAILRTHVEKILGIANPENAKLKKSTEPNWEALNA